MEAQRVLPRKAVATPASTISHPMPSARRTSTWTAANNQVPPTNAATGNATAPTTYAFLGANTKLYKQLRIGSRNSG
jgi:hypothetical protein